MTDASASSSMPRHNEADKKTTTQLDNYSPPPSSSSRQHFSSWLRSLIGRKNETSLRETLADLIEENDNQDSSNPISAHENMLMANVLKLRDLVVEDCMVPRADITAIDSQASLEDILHLAINKPHSRFPVYNEQLDDVIGIFHIKDILPFLAEKTDFDFKNALRPPMIIAPSMPVLDLLLDMRQKRTHMALVIDEFGGIDGLITIEDLVEEIVGEIEDEHDQSDDHIMIERPDKTLIASARVAIDEFEDTYGTILDDEEREEIDTLGGLVFALSGQVPSRGALISHPCGIQFEILDADPRKIKKLRIHNLSSLSKK